MSADPGENEAMSARGEFMARCGDAQLTIVAYDAVVWALAEIDRLRAACVVAQEDADRQDAALRQMLDRYLAAVNLNDLAVPPKRPSMPNRCLRRVLLQAVRGRRE